MKKQIDELRKLALDTFERNEHNEHARDVIKLIAEIIELEAIVEKARAVFNGKKNLIRLFEDLNKLQQALAAHDAATKEAK